MILLSIKPKEKTMSKLSNDTRIYLKDFNKVRLADYRVRIVRESNPREPCDNEDLVFEKANGEVPAEAIYTWYFAPMGVTFYTTPERCKKMVSDDPSYWTQQKLEEFAKIEGRLYRDWYDGYVYGIVVEKWDEKQRKWALIDSKWGMYGAKDVYDNIGDEIDLLHDELGGASIPVFMDEEEMKYEFDNTEKKTNEFDN